VDRDRNAKLGASPVQQARMAASLVMHIEPSPHKCCDDLFGLKYRQLRHASRNLRDGDRNPLRRYFSDVARDWFSGLKSAFQIAPDRVARHLTSFLKSLSVGADLRDRGNEHIEPTF